MSSLTRLCRHFFSALFAAEPACRDMFEEALGSSAWRREAFVRHVFETLLLAAADRAYVSSAAMRERAKLYRFWQLTPAMYRAFNASFVNALATALGAASSDATSDADAAPLTAAQLQSWLGVLDSLAHALSDPAPPASSSKEDLKSSNKGSASTVGSAALSNSAGETEDARRAAALRVCQSLLGNPDALAKLSGAFFGSLPKCAPALAELFDEALTASAWRRVETLRRVLELIALCCVQPLTALSSAAFLDRGTFCNSVRAPLCSLCLLQCRATPFWACNKA